VNSTRHDKATWRQRLWIWVLRALMLLCEQCTKTLDCDVLMSRSTPVCSARCPGGCNLVGGTALCPIPTKSAGATCLAQRDRGMALDGKPGNESKTFDDSIAVWFHSDIEPGGGMSVAQGATNAGVTPGVLRKSLPTAALVDSLEWRAKALYDRLLIALGNLSQCIYMD